MPGASLGFTPLRPAERFVVRGVYTGYCPAPLFPGAEWNPSFVLVGQEAL